jgi:hypothetical protein
MPQVLVALPIGLAQPEGRHLCAWASQWNGRHVATDRTGGQCVERYSFGGDDDATCHHLETWTDGCQGEVFTVSIGDERALTGRVGSKRA